MEVVIVGSQENGARIVADAIQRLVGTEAQPTLGVATGSSPLLVYRELIDRFRHGTLSFASTTCFLLDEYVGLEPDHHESYHSFIRREFTDHIDLPADAILGPDATPADLADAGVRYEESIAGRGGIDIQLLGIGTDGHIGFNEPSSSLGSRTRVKTLTLETRTANARFFEGQLDEVPRYALTQGIGTILEARHLILIASGPGKADAVARAIEGPLTAAHPASALQLHPHVTVVIDDFAASELAHANYYRETFAGKPDWQDI